MAFFLKVLLLVVVVGLPNGPVQANMASPYQSGDLLAEPHGGSKNVDILCEFLNINLHTLTDSGLAEIEATYIVNSANDIELPLLFVADALRLGGNSVWLDGVRISHAENIPAELSPGWEVTPSLRLDSFYHLRAYDSLKGHPRTGALSFLLKIRAGEHKIVVRYKAQPDYFSTSSELTRKWLLTYSLYPAKAWKSFGDLFITIKAPSDWTIQSNLTFSRHADSLTGVFDGIPADDLSLIIQMPSPSVWLSNTFIGIFAFMMVGGTLFFCYRMGRALQRKERSALWMFPVNIVLGVVLAIVLGVLALLLGDYSLGKHYSPVRSYGSVITLVFLLFGLVVVVTVLGQVAVLRGKRRELEDQLMAKQMQ